MAGVIRAPETLGQIASVRSYTRQFDERAADRPIRRLLDAGNSLDHLPHRERPCPDGARELVTVRPYVVCHDTSDEGVTILAVRHTRRQPVER